MPRVGGDENAIDEKQQVILRTTEGSLIIELYPLDAPKACANFVGLAKKGYYNGTIFHRLVKDSILQGGDPTGTGTGGSSLFGYLFENEISSRLGHRGAGILAMAASSDGKNGSQFYITMGPVPQLDGQNTIFGRIAEGMSTLKRINEFSVDANDRPYTAIKIIATEVRQAEPVSRPVAVQPPPRAAASRTVEKEGEVVPLGTSPSSQPQPQAAKSTVVGKKGSLLSRFADY